MLRACNISIVFEQSTRRLEQHSRLFARGDQVCQALASTFVSGARGDQVCQALAATSVSGARRDQVCQALAATSVSCVSSCAKVKRQKKHYVLSTTIHPEKARAL